MKKTKAIQKYYEITKGTNETTIHNYSETEVHTVKTPLFQKATAREIRREQNHEI